MIWQAVAWGQILCANMLERCNEALWRIICWSEMWPLSVDCHNNKYGWVISKIVNACTTCETDNFALVTPIVHSYGLEYADIAGVRINTIFVCAHFWSNIKWTSPDRMLIYNGSLCYSSRILPLSFSLVTFSLYTLPFSTCCGNLIAATLFVCFEKIYILRCVVHGIRTMHTWQCRFRTHIECVNAMHRIASMQMFSFSCLLDGLA